MLIACCLVAAYVYTGLLSLCEDTIANLKGIGFSFHEVSFDLTSSGDKSLKASIRMMQFFKSTDFLGFLSVCLPKQTMDQDWESISKKRSRGFLVQLRLSLHNLSLSLNCKSGISSTESSSINQVLTLVSTGALQSRILPSNCRFFSGFPAPYLSSFLSSQLPCACCIAWNMCMRQSMGFCPQSQFSRTCFPQIWISPMKDYFLLSSLI